MVDTQNPTTMNHHIQFTVSGDTVTRTNTNGGHTMVVARYFGPEVGVVHCISEPADYDRMVEEMPTHWCVTRHHFISSRKGLADLTLGNLFTHVAAQGRLGAYRELIRVIRTNEPNL